MKKVNFFSVANSFALMLAFVLGLSMNASAQCVLTCNDLVQVSLDASCTATLVPDQVLEGDQALQCPAGVLVVEMKVGSNWVPAVLTAAHINQTVTVRVRDTASGQICWGTVHVEDKLPPVLTCTPITVSCAVNGTSAGFAYAYDPRFFATADNVATTITCEGLGLLNAFPNNLPFTPGQIVFQGNNTFLVLPPTAQLMENCSAVTLSYDDQLTDFPCGNTSGFSASILRRWTAVDAQGNVGTCNQTINFTRAILSSVVFPTDITLECSAANTDPSVTGSPYIAFGTCRAALWPANNTLCEMNVTYTDQVIPVCDGTYKILRTWVLYDWCLPTTPGVNPFYSIQLIKVVDTTPPVVECPENITIGVDAWSCDRDFNLPDLIVSDACSRIASAVARYRINGIWHSKAGSVTSFPGNNLWNPDTLAVFPTIDNLPLGKTKVQLTVTDDCGNPTTCEIDVTVEDDVPPVAICTEFTQVSLGANGEVLVPASVFDQGSYDNCAPVHFKVRRMSPNTCAPDENHTQFHDAVNFCCDDIGDTIIVVLRVYDVDVDAGDVALGYAASHANDCMVQVFVDDKLKPVCQAPANVTVSCESFDPSLWVYGNPTAYDNCCLDTITTTVNYNSFDNTCNRGTIVRTFRAFDCRGLSSQCQQSIVVTYTQDYWVRFPGDKTVTVCDGSSDFGTPEVFKKDCELIGISHDDITYTVVADACYKIERTWQVINWCTYNPNLGCTNVPNPVYANPANEANFTVVAPAGTNPSGWNETKAPIVVNGPTVNFSTYWAANTNCYRYMQIVKVVDTQAPTATCDAYECDYTLNDAGLWNGPEFWDATSSSHDLCEHNGSITMEGSDLCSGTNVNLYALLFLDLDNDGTMETVLNSNTWAGLARGTVPYNNAHLANYPLVNIRQFDTRNVSNRFRFNLVQTVANGVRSAKIVFDGTAIPGEENLVKLPYGKHKIKWIVSDNCGNETFCEKQINVHDCKKPTVVCLNGLSVNIMNVDPTSNIPATITLWASDFLQYAEDNCTPSDQLVIGIRKSGTGTGFPLNANGTPQTSVRFNCDELGTQYVEVWAKDAEGNADFCETYVIVQDNMNICTTGSVANVTGSTMIDFNVAPSVSGVENVSIALTGTPSNGSPAMSNFTNTNNVGHFNFNAIPVSTDVTVTPTNNNDPLNGVSTYDLLLISKHILGVQPLDSPYKMIAADANKSGSITTFDILELRKLILGIYNDLPANNSWRFVRKSQVLNAANPFAAAIEENVTYASLLAGESIADFQAVKIGDVNGNAVANASQVADDRAAGTLFFDVQDRTVKAGEEVVVNFTAAEKMAGFQFAMSLNGLKVAEIMGNDKLSASNFGVFANLLTASVDGASDFAVKFVATKDGDLNKMIGLSAEKTKSEAYTNGGDRYNVAFRFNGANGSVVAGAGFELLQNTPNPVANTTVITFNLPEAGNATLTVSNAEGRVIKTINNDFVKGINTVTLNRAELQAGILFYQLDTKNNSAVKKMIVVD